MYSQSFHTHCGVIKKCKTGVCKLTFLISSMKPLWIKASNWFGARAETYFLAPCDWFPLYQTTFVSSPWCIKDGWNKKVVFKNVSGYLFRQSDSSSYAKYCSNLLLQDNFYWPIGIKYYVDMQWCKTNGSTGRSERISCALCCKRKCLVRDAFLHLLPMGKNKRIHTAVNCFEFSRKNFSVSL